MMTFGLGRMPSAVSGASTRSECRRPSVPRRVLLDLIEEYVRHVSHADLIRESVDGLTGEDPEE
jgi:hypothetical protein